MLLHMHKRTSIPHGGKYHVTITVYSSSEHQLRNWLSENASEKQVQVNDYYERFKSKSLPVDSTRGESYSCHL